MIACPGCGDITRTRRAMNEHIAEYHPEIAPYIDDANEPELWVAGWSMQWALMIGAAVCLWNDVSVQGSIFVTGSIVIGVVRAIEKDRRAERCADRLTPPRG